MTRMLPSQTGSDYTRLAEELLDAAWNTSRQTNGTDTAIPIQLAIAQIYGLLAVAEEVRGLRDLLGRSYT